MHRFFLAAFCAILVSCQKSENQVTLVIPVEHTAMNDIQNGFIIALKDAHPDCKVDIQNAMGDPSLMQSILRNALSGPSKVVATIGVSTTTAARNIARSGFNQGGAIHSIIGIAANKDLLTDTYQNDEIDEATYLIEDEIGPDTLFASVKAVFPEVKKVTLIHAQDDKIIKEARGLETLMKANGINIQMLPILHTNDLQTVCPHIQGEIVLILKDHSVVSGLNVILKHTGKSNIPLVASDEGSVKNGATYAFGVSEYNTGIQAGKAVSQIISGKTPEPITKLDPMYIINDKTPPALVERMRAQNNVPVYEVASHA